MMLGAYNIPKKPNVEEMFVVEPPGTSATRVPLPISTTAFGHVSPDSKWLAYASAESGR